MDALGMTSALSSEIFLLIVAEMIKVSVISYNENSGHESRREAQ